MMTNQEYSQNSLFGVAFRKLARVYLDKAKINLAEGARDQAAENLRRASQYIQTIFPMDGTIRTHAEHRRDRIIPHPISSHLKQHIISEPLRPLRITRRIK